MIEQASWLQGIADLAAHRELRLIANNERLLIAALKREVENINEGLGFEAVRLQGV